MSECKVGLDLGAVQETLLLPLWARAKETEKKSPIVVDTYARDVVQRLDYDFSTFESEPEIANNQQLTWTMRAYNFDSVVRRFLENNDDALVVNIGAGLDTAFQRVDNGKVLWVNIDLPDVVALRRKLIPDSERELTIARSIFDFDCTAEVAQLAGSRSLLFMAAGVLFYFTSDQVRTLLQGLAGAFPGAHFVFDAISSWIWVYLTNWAIMRKSGLRSEAQLKWHLNKASTLKKWVDTIEVIEEYSMFSRVPSTEGLSRAIRRDLRIAEFIGIYNIFHVRL